MSFLIVMLSLFSFNSFSNFCEQRMDHKKLRSLFEKKENLFDFDNDAGLFNQGTCWWHSRLQRKSIYLAKFNPDKKKGDVNKIKKIIRALIKGRKVIDIDGIRDFKQLTKENRDYILNRLTLWQLKDGIIKFSWITGLRGRTKVKSEKLHRRIEELYYYVKKGNIAYTKLQLPGIPSHAWLVTDVIKTDSGYALKFLDSNYQSSLRTYHYKNGDSTFRFRSYGNFTPYLEQKNENKKLKKKLKKYCQRRK